MSRCNAVTLVMCGVIVVIATLTTLLLGCTCPADSPTPTCHYAIYGGSGDFDICAETDSYTEVHGGAAVTFVPRNVFDGVPYHAVEGRTVTIWHPMIIDLRDPNPVPPSPVGPEVD